jgi:hypothetical protein
MSFEGQAIFYSDQNLITGEQLGGQIDTLKVEKDQAFLKFMHFVLETQDKNIYIYR